MFEVGVKLPVGKIVCEGVDKCKDSNPSFELGRVYEIRANITPGTPLTPSDIPHKVWALIAKTREEYPGIIINYLAVSDDGSQITIQVVDQGGYMIIAYIILAIVVFVGLHYVLNDLVVLTETVGKHLPTPPTGPAGTAVWVMVALGASAVGLGYLIRSFRKKK